MKKEKHSKEKSPIEKNTLEENDIVNDIDNEASSVSEENNEQGETIVNEEVEKLKSAIDEKTRQCEELKNMVQRTAAEFDNYKKRTLKEKESLSLDVAIDTVNAILPVVDNLERALKAAEGMESNPLKDGVEMVMRQLNDCLSKLGVEPIAAVGNKFDPEIHNAVMHDTDDEKSENLIVEEFQRGYLMKGKIVRYSMVKVVN